MSHDPERHRREDDDEEEEDNLLAEDDAGEEVEADGDVQMDSDDESEEIQLQNDSIAHFDHHTDSVFCIAAHPRHHTIIATGGGDETAYVFDITKSPAAAAAQGGERASIPPLFKIEGHKDSVNAITYTLPTGNFLASAGLDGQLRVYRTSADARSYKLLGTATEVEEINWLAACPHPDQPDVLALGASDGSVWVYRLNKTGEPALEIVQAFYLHTAPCTAGTWSADGSLLATVSEDGSFYVWDVFGDAAAAGVVSPASGQSFVVGLDGNDERFRVDGGLVSVAIAPNGSFAAVGGMDGGVRVVSLPRASAAGASNTTGKGGAGAKAKAGGGRQAGGPSSGAGQAGVLLASINTQAESVESIAFAPAPATLMATASVDGSIVLYDTAKNFAVRRHLKAVHQEEAVIKVEFGSEGQGWMMTSCGNDGVVRREDVRTGGAREWKGHRGGGEGGGVMGFVQVGGKIVTAGDDKVVLVFDTA